MSFSIGGFSGNSASKNWSKTGNKTTFARRASLTEIDRAIRPKTVIEICSLKNPTPLKIDISSDFLITKIRAKTEISATKTIKTPLKIYV